MPSRELTGHVTNDAGAVNWTVLELGKIVKKSVEKQNMLAWQYNAVGVSDAITMGGEGLSSIPPSPFLPAQTESSLPTGMRYSLQSRDLIADSIETVTLAQHHDANIAIPGCDKNMPGVVMAAARHNRPFIMIVSQGIGGA